MQLLKPITRLEKELWHPLVHSLTLLLYAQQRLLLLYWVANMAITHYPHYPMFLHLKMSKFAKTNHPHGKSPLKMSGQEERLVYKKTPKIESYQTQFIDIVKETKTWYGTPVQSIQGNAIQFKTKRGRGNYAIRLLDMNGNKSHSA